MVFTACGGDKYNLEIIGTEVFVIWTAFSNVHTRYRLSNELQEEYHEYVSKLIEKELLKEE